MQFCIIFFSIHKKIANIATLQIYFLYSNKIECNKQTSLQKTLFISGYKYLSGVENRAHKLKKDSAKLSVLWPFDLWESDRLREVLGLTIK